MSGCASARARMGLWSDWLALAAAPSFAVMAVLTAAFDGGAVDLLCGSATDGFPLDGMVPMYVLMSAVHLAPWLKRLARRA